MAPCLSVFHLVTAILGVAFLRVSDAARIDVVNLLGDDLNQADSQLSQAVLAPLHRFEDSPAINASASNSSVAADPPWANMSLIERHGDIANEPHQVLEELNLNVSATPNARPQLLQTAVAAAEANARHDGDAFPWIELSDMKKNFKIYMILFAVLVCLCCCCCARCFGESLERNQVISGGRLLYEWDQTPGTVTMYTQWPRHVSKKDLGVFIGSRRVEISRKDKEPPTIKGEFYADIDADASVCNMNRKSELQITFTKTDESAWPCVLMAHHPDK